jgi:hypothetical protein
MTVVFMDSNSTRTQMLQYVQLSWYHDLGGHHPLLQKFYRQMFLIFVVNAIYNSQEYVIYSWSRLTKAIQMRQPVHFVTANIF